MARGPKKHMKRLAAPKHWMVDKLLGVYAPKCNPGAHKGRESLPLLLVLRNRLRFALNRNEAMMITKQRLVHVDNRARTDPKYPVGFMDILSVPKTQEKFRVLYDVKGRFVLNKCSDDLKLCKVTRCFTTEGNVPTLTTHDGRTFRYADPLIKKGDTIQFNLVDNKIVDFVKFKTGVFAMVTGGANTGRVGTVVDVETHPGSFDIVHVKDNNNNTFATRRSNIFVLGRRESECLCDLPKGKGLRMPLTQDREQRISAYAKSKAGKKNKN